MKIIGLILRKCLPIIKSYNLFVIAIFCYCSCGSSKGQQDNTLVKYDSLTRQDVYISIEKMPSYTGGNSAFMVDFNKNFHYDYSLFPEETIQTKLQVQFVIDEKGNLTGSRIHNKSTNKQLTEFEKAGLNALNLMQNWQAGMHNDKPVSVLLTQIIHIDMNK